MKNLQAKNDKTAIKIHEAASLFPQMSDAAFLELKNDIAHYGQQVPIIIQNGYLLDGRHRYRACRELGIEPNIQEIPASNDPVHQLVASLNLHRRHLADGQRAVIAARLANLDVGANQHTAQAVSQAQAASDLKVSIDSLQRAKSVLLSGSPGLIKMVEAGSIGVSSAACLATLPETTQIQILQLSEKEILEKAKALRKAKTAVRRAKIIEAIEAKRANNVPLDPRGGPFDIIYADPPWDYLGETVVGYPTMTLADICAMPVTHIASDDAVLFMWCSASLIREALSVIDAWGFTYKTHSVWDKMSPGQGSYFRVQHELLLVATRGKVPEVPPASRPSSVFSVKRREHSRKPAYAYEMIESMYPEMNKLELFCRGIPQPNWHGWGNECLPACDFTEQVLPPTAWERDVAAAKSNIRPSMPKKLEPAYNDDQYHLTKEAA